MKRRYSIWGTQHGANYEVELAQVDSNPQPVLDGFAAMIIPIKKSATAKGTKKSKIRKYTWLRIVENG
jgi:hypothetical protein